MSTGYIKVSANSWHRCNYPRPFVVDISTPEKKAAFDDLLYRTAIAEMKESNSTREHVAKWEEELPKKRKLLESLQTLEGVESDDTISETKDSIQDSIHDLEEAITETKEELALVEAAESGDEEARQKVLQWIGKKWSISPIIIFEPSNVEELNVLAGKAEEAHKTIDIHTYEYGFSY